MPRKSASHGDPSSSNRIRFLSNHALVLLVIGNNPNILQRDIAEHLQLTERAVQRIVVELERAGYLTRQKAGRVNNYKLHLKLFAPDPLCQHIKLGDLLELLQK